MAVVAVETQRRGIEAILPGPMVSEVASSARVVLVRLAAQVVRVARVELGVVELVGRSRFLDQR